MRGNLLIRTVVVGMLVGLVFSCSSKKSTVSVGAGEKKVSRLEREEVIQQVKTHQLHFTTFSGRAKSKIIINRENYDVTANVRIERDKAIWISMTALMGVEVGRALITPDSIRIINRVQGTYLDKPFAHIYHFTNEKLDFFNLQQLLIGNVIQEAFRRDSEIWGNGRGYSLRGHHNDLQYSAQLNTSYRPTFTVLNDLIRDHRMEASYEDYQSLAGRTFPSQVKISIISEGLKLQSEMRYSRVVYDDTLDMPFNIPTRYKEIQ